MSLTGAVISITLVGFLSLEFNPKLSGTIPSQLGNLRFLTTLTAYDNGINGSVPQELCALAKGNLTKLEFNCEVDCACCDGFCF